MKKTELRQIIKEKKDLNQDYSYNDLISMYKDFLKQRNFSNKKGTGIHRGINADDITYALQDKYGFNTNKIKKESIDKLRQIIKEEIKKILIANNREHNEKIRVKTIN